MRKPRSEVSTLEAPGTKCYVYRGSRDRKHVENLDEISEIIREPSSLVWFDVVAPGPHDLALLQEEFDLHPLAIEDALGSHQRAKIESYGQYVFLIVHGVTHAAEGLRTHEIAIFAGESFVVTVRHAPAYPIEELRTRWHDGIDGKVTDAPALVHAILDTLVDGYLPISDAFETRLDELENVLLDQGRISSGALRQISAMRKDLNSFRRAVVPMREILAIPIRGDSHFFTRDDLPYYRDVLDHVLLVIDRIDSTREAMTNVLETNIGISSNRQNEVSKQLTLIATIFLPLTFITGFFGQNFGWLVDNIKSLQSFVVLGIGTEIVAVIALLTYFRLRGWR